MKVQEGAQIKGEMDRGYTLGKALNQIGMGWFQYLLAVLCGFFLVIDACQLFMMTFLIPVLQDVWDLESPWDSMIGIVFLVGVLCASINWSKIGDIYGRRTTLIWGITILAISTTATIFVTNIYQLYICRFIGGLGYVQSVVFIILLEFSPINARANIMGYLYFCWAAGGMLSIILAWLILPAMDEDVGWRYYVLATSVPNWMVVLMTYWLPESPYWYCTVAKFDEAQKLIQRIAKMNGKEPLKGRLIQENKLVEKRGKIKDVFIPVYRNTSFLLVFGYAAIFFVYYGVVFLSKRLFEDYSLYSSELITNLAEIPGIILGMYMFKIDWKWMTIYTTVIPALSLAIAAILYPYIDYVTYIWVINVILVFAARGLSLTGTMILLSNFTAYYPTAIRATALGLALALCRVASMVDTYIIEDLQIEIDLTILTIVSLVACGISVGLKDISGKQKFTNDVDRSIRETTTTLSSQDSIKQYILPV